MDAALPLENHAREILRRYLHTVMQEARRAGSEPQEDPVHDVRVAIRRWSQALRTFRDLLPKGMAKRLRRGARALLDAAGATRDYDIGVSLLTREGLGEDHPLLQRWRNERERAALAVKAHVLLLEAADRESEWLSALNAPLAPREPAAEFARQTLPALAEGFFAAGRKAVQKAGDAARLHAFRLAAKRFRYTLELFSPFYGPALQVRIGKVREIQSILGKRQDCAVTAERIHPMAEFDPAIAAVYGRLQTRSARLEEQFLRYWHEAFDAPGELTRWQRYLSRRLPQR